MEAWRLLGAGRLRAAAQLAAALSAIGGSVPALLMSCKPPDLPHPTPASVAKGKPRCLHLPALHACLQLGKLLLYWR